MKVKCIFNALIVSCVIAVAAGTVAAQDGVQTRNITSDGFTKARNNVSQSAGSSAIKTVPRIYKYVRADKNPVRHKAPLKPVMRPATLKRKVTELGVTVWRLRPPRESEKDNILFTVLLEDKKTTAKWLAERVGTDTAFKAGDKVRFAVETSTPGYIYVIDRETLANGSFGQPLLIYPTSASDDNLIKPGELFDFPDRNDPGGAYLNIDPKKPGYSGELVTVIISPKPLTGITTDKDGYVTNGTLLTDLEFGASFEIYSREDSDNKFYSKAESDGSCGIKTRELRPPGASTQAPCGSATRPLGVNEPLPQTIYSVTSYAGEPVVAFLKMNVVK
ncbi:MAG: DUF4384 domain-containing protein [Acidobacteriota bacterium]